MGAGVDATTVTGLLGGDVVVTAARMGVAVATLDFPPEPTVVHAPPVCTTTVG